MSKDEVSKKRARPDDLEEIEIDITAAEPLSKRAARRLKKGRSLQHAPSAKKRVDIESEEDDDDESDAHSADGHDNGPEEPKRGLYGIWIGNLSFKTTEQDLLTFFTTVKPMGKLKKASEFASILPKDITRISLSESDKIGENKGYAHIDFANEEVQETAIALSERILQSRNVLIKAADSFEGRPKAAEIPDEKPTKPNDAPTKRHAAKKPPTKILYIGNLPFEATSEGLKKHLGGKPAGIKKVRMATFEDTGKCKGFAFIDFEAITHVEAVLANDAMWSIDGRQLKLEFGEDRSQRLRPNGTKATYSREKQDKWTTEGSIGKIDARTITPGSALANAQRGSVAVVPSQGQKISFD